jgi:hypothetical protein
MKTTLPPILESKLADFRRRVWVVKVLEGLLAGVAGVYVSWLMLFVLDRFIDTPVWARWMLMLGGSAVLGLGLPLKWHRWVWRQRRLEDAARLLKRTFPRLSDQLLGIVELSRQEDTSRSERLVQAAAQQAADAVRDKELNSAMPTRVLTRWTWAASLLMLLFALAWFGVPLATKNTMARWLMPWKNIERFTFARIEPLPEKLVVPLAEPVKLTVKLDKETRWSPQGAKASLEGQPLIQSTLKDGAYVLALPPQKDDATLKLSLGDVREQIAVLPRARPELTTLAVRTKLPAYLKYQTQPVIEVRGGSVSVLKGAQASIEATASRELASASLDGQSQTVSGDKMTTSFSELAADAEKTMTWKDRDGLEPREPLVLRLHAVEDEAPKLAARRESLEQVVLDTEVVTFEVDAQDDFGIQRVGLEWRSVNDESTKGDKIAAAGEPEKKTLNAKATFSAVRDGVTPQTLEIRAWAEDYLPGRKRAYSAAFQLQILNKTDHAFWLTEQFGKWLESARETYEREQQLHATNRELRQMKPEELDRPENRRRITQQSSAEIANAARLGALNQSGRSLVEQATQNDEFDAQRLESWATMLQSLQDIASKKMPSVADLLKQSAGAKTQTSQSSQQSQKFSAQQLANGEQSPKSGSQSKPSDEEQKKANMPSIADREGSMSKPVEAKNDPNAKSAPPKPGALKLPTTQMAASSLKEGEKDGGPPPTPAQQKMDEAIEEQELLLAEFAKVSDELAAVLASLEASTFVKRLKKASRDQMVAAKDLNTKTLIAFGLEKQPVKEAASIAEHEKGQSEVVRIIQSDLEAYYARKPELHFKKVISQMKEMQVVKALQTLGDKAALNLSGSSMIGAEFWADTLDRWAEEMVAASECKACSSCSSDSLPPEIVLKVMKALRDEMKLRDETRELENAKPALNTEVYSTKSNGLASKQFGIRQNVLGALDAIMQLPDGNQKFGKELKLLDAVMQVMDEAGTILDKPNTGTPAIAAETEAIELLLQAKRPNPKGGGGGGGGPGGGGSAASSSLAALADLGEGNDTASQVETRPVGQATGKAGRELPEEFKTGLDNYFSKLEEAK